MPATQAPDIGEIANRRGVVQATPIRGFGVSALEDVTGDGRKDGLPWYTRLPGVGKKTKTFKTSFAHELVEEIYKKLGSEAPYHYQRLEKRFIGDGDNKGLAVLVDELSLIDPQHIILGLDDISGKLTEAFDSISLKLNYGYLGRAARTEGREELADSVKHALEGIREYRKRAYAAIAEELLLVRSAKTPHIAEMYNIALNYRDTQGNSFFLLRGKPDKTGVLDKIRERLRQGSIESNMEALLSSYETQWNNRHTFRNGVELEGFHRNFEDTKSDRVQRLRVIEDTLSGLYETYGHATLAEYQRRIRGLHKLLSQRRLCDLNIEERLFGSNIKDWEDILRSYKKEISDLSKNFDGLYDVVLPQLGRLDRIRYELDRLDAHMATWGDATITFEERDMLKAVYDKLGQMRPAKSDSKGNPRPDYEANIQLIRSMRERIEPYLAPAGVLKSNGQVYFRPSFKN